MSKWEKASPEMIREITRQAELFLDGQVKLATSADQRASVLGGIFTAAGTAIIAGLIAAPSYSLGLVVGALLSAIMFLIGAGLCICTALPAGFYLPGNHPESWDDEVREQKSLDYALSTIAQNYQEEIEHNKTTLKTNAGKFKLGTFLGLCAPLVGLIAWFLLSVEWPTSGR